MKYACNWPWVLLYWHWALEPEEAWESGVAGEADTVAFGLTLWEMMTLSIPHITLLDDDDDGMIIFLM